MENIQIKSLINGSILFEGEFNNLKQAVEAATKQRANLSGANLSGANLSPIKYEFFGKMFVLHSEVRGLRQALIGGKIDGSSYEGECACFVGTCANVAKTDYKNLLVKPDAASLTEKWFLAIRVGDTPENSAVTKLTLDWIDEFLTILNSKI